MQYNNKIAIKREVLRGAKYMPCEFCDNATTNRELTFENDLSYRSIGMTDKNYSMLLKTGDNKPTQIIVQKWLEKYQCNTVIAKYTMQYCPECGRKLIENKRRD